MVSKKEKIQQLAAFRRDYVFDSKISEKFQNLGGFFGGIFEQGWVTPYSVGAQNLDARVMIVLQDWCSDEYLNGLSSEEAAELSRIGHDRTIRTNINLKKLLQDHLSLELKETYATNLCPFIKRGKMNGPIPAGLAERFATDFTFKEIQIIMPEIIICCGIPSFNALAAVCGLRRCANLDEAVACPFKIGETWVYAVCHPGDLGVNNRNRGGVDRNKSDWERIHDKRKSAA